MATLTGFAGPVLLNALQTGWLVVQDLRGLVPWA